MKGRLARTDDAEAFARRERDAELDVSVAGVGAAGVA